MERIDGVVGNVHADDELAALRAEHDERGTLERVVIDADNRRRSRFRATTDAGTDVGVVVDTAAVSAGDVLLVEDDRMIVVAFEPRDALAVSLPDATDEALEAAVELGHRIGNQHWDLAVEDGVVYVPLEADRHIVERVVADVVPGSEIRETTVEADLFVTDIDDAGAHDVDHEHSHGGEHEHGHDHAHEHGGDREHSHAHDGRGHERAEHSHGHDHSREHDHDH
ncbi:urease accessory protein UreE [Haloterrigena turkmenica DSM 5511]|uniref:Urease accessory protein UreE n=1 Tax=Haloterrigena turkmenica (strain ATCC 51198 / DSM 5511 / JCM 9101 / NCIMB 13204 / VKM B-1734 / 4k) TaxID=543526 RepID=D2RQV9_HALTV|nr:urease accessory protein UreE [Haloterrigena turkmenica]ADB60440.1 urease accessory protein UreE [Haloterrigena turkmenica DSM 5511]